MSRFTTSRERRALPAPKPVRVHRRRERRPTGGGRFFRAEKRGADVPDVEQIRSIFRRVLTGTDLGRKLGYDDESA